MQQYIDHRNHREAQILDVLQDARPGGIAIEGIVEKLYMDVPKAFHAAAGANVFLHLQKLLHEGRVLRESADGKTLYNVDDVESQDEREASEKLQQLLAQEKNSVWKCTHQQRL